VLFSNIYFFDIEIGMKGKRMVRMSELASVQINVDHAGYNLIKVYKVSFFLVALVSF